jgi:hypothetical protein
MVFASQIGDMVQCVGSSYGAARVRASGRRVGDSDSFDFTSSPSLLPLSFAERSSQGSGTQ